MLVCEDLVVDELLHFLHVYHHSAQHICGSILLMSDYSEEEMVGGDSVAACPHCLFSGKINDRAELV